LSWTVLANNPLAITIIGGVAVLFIGWLFKRVFSDKRMAEPTVQQHAHQSFQPTININTAGAAPVLPSGRASFRSAQERNAISPEEAKERLLSQLENQLDMRIVDIELIHTSDIDEFVQKMQSAIWGIKGFFETHPELRPLNLELLKPLVNDDFYRHMKQEARIEWANRRFAESEQQHPCVTLVNEMVEHLLMLRVRRDRTMKDYRATIPR